MKKTTESPARKTTTNSRTGRDEVATTKRTTTTQHPELRGLLEGQLKDIYWSEKAVSRTIPTLIQKATSGPLVDALNQHLAMTEKQISRCEQVFQKLNLQATPHKSDAMESLIREASGLIDSTASGYARDAGILCSAQKIDSYKLATYGAMENFARQLGEKEAARLIRDTVQEEKEAGNILNKVADHNLKETAHAV